MDSTKSAATKKHCFIEEDDQGLVSMVDKQAGFSGNQNHYYPLVSRPLYNYTSSSSMLKRSHSLRNVSSSGFVSSPRSGNNLRFYEEPHFLDSCFGCKKPLGDNKDIFMYRGDTPFCSEECRQEQIEMDEAQEKSLNLSAASMRALRKKEQRKSTSSNNTPQDCPIRSSTVAAA